MGENAASSLGSALSYQYLSAISFVASGAVFYIIVAKLLPTYTLGSISLLLAIASLLNIIFSFGFPISAQHFISFYLGKGDQVETHFIAIRLITISAVLSLASFLFTLLTAKTFAIIFFHDPSDSALIDVASVYVAVNILFGVLHGSALGFQMFKIDAIIYLSSASLSYIVGLAMLLFFHGIFYFVIGIIVCYFYGSALYIIFVFFKRQKFGGKSNKTTFQQIMSYSWPIILSGLLGYGSTYVDRFVVAYLLNLTTLGIYSFVLLVSSSLTFVAGPIVNIIVPKLSEFFSLNDREKLEKGVNLSSALLVLIYSPLVLGIAAVAPIVLTLLARAIYASGYIALMILLWVSSICVIWNILSSVIYAVRKTRVYILITSITMISNISLSFILIPRIGMVGAAIANSSVLVLSFVIAYYYAILREIINYDWVTTIKIWISAVTMFVVVFIERTFIGNGLTMLPLYITTGAIVYAVMLNLTHSLNNWKIEEFMGYIPTRLGLRKVVKIILSWAF